MENQDLIKISGALLNRSIKYQKREILDKPNIVLEEIIKGHDDPYTFGDITENASNAKKSIELFYGSYKALKETLDQTKIFKGQFCIVNSFLDIYSIFISAKLSLEYLVNTPGEESSTFNGQKLDFRTGSFNTSINLIKAYKESINSLNGSSEALLGATKNYFRWIIDQTNTELKNNEYQELLKKTEKLNIEINGLILDRALAGDQRINKDLIGKITYEDIIGNEYAISICREIISNIGCYSNKTRSNYATKHMDRPYVILFYGRPGTGKGMLMNAIEADLSYSASLKGIEYQRIKIDNALIKRKYHGDGPRAFKEAFAKAKDSNNISLLIIDDVEGVLQDRDAPDSLHLENELLNVALDQIDGFEKDYIGNFAVVMATNQMRKIDNALLSRSTDILEVKGLERLDHYQKFMGKYLLTDFRRYIIGGDDTVNKIANVCYRLNLAGRDVKTYLSNISRFIKGGIVPYEIRSMEGHEQETALKAMYQRVDLNIMRNYLKGVSNGRKPV